MLDTLTKKQFIYWLKKRLTNKYKEEDVDVLKEIDNILYNYTIVPTIVDEETIDNICAKYFNTFVKDDEYLLRDILGEESYSEHEEQIRMFVVGMVSEVFKSQYSLKAKYNHKQNDDHGFDELSFL